MDIFFPTTVFKIKIRNFSKRETHKSTQIHTNPYKSCHSKNCRCPSTLGPNPQCGILFSKMLSMLSNHRWEQSMHCPSMPAGPPVTQSYLDMCCKRCQQSLWNNTCSQTNKKHHGIQLRMRSPSKLTLRPNLLLGPVAFKQTSVTVRVNTGLQATTTCCHSSCCRRIAEGKLLLNGEWRLFPRAAESAEFLFAWAVSKPGAATHQR